jgi:hypothetical protein
MSRDCPVTVLGLSRDIGCFLTFSLFTLAVPIGGAAGIEARLNCLDFLDGNRNSFRRRSCLRHAADEGC